MIAAIVILVARAGILWLRLLLLVMAVVLIVLCCLLTVIVCGVLTRVISREERSGHHARLQFYSPLWFSLARELLLGEGEDGAGELSQPLGVPNLGYFPRARGVDWVLQDQS